MKKLLLFPVFIVLGMVMPCCSGHKNPSDVAAQVAKQYYDYLISGDYESFVRGHYRDDSIPDSYREQLITNIKMFVGQQQTERKGIKATRIVSATADTASHTANVLMLFMYGDSTSEEVSIPMVEHAGVWYMR